MDFLTGWEISDILDPNLEIILIFYEGATCRRVFEQTGLSRGHSVGFVCVGCIGLT